MDAIKERERTRTMKGSLDEDHIKYASKQMARRMELQWDMEEGRNTYTRSPGESSVYNLSMVLEDPPAPAARVEFGRAA